MTIVTISYNQPILKIPTVQMKIAHVTNAIDSDIS